MERFSRPVTLPVFLLLIGLLAITEAGPLPEDSCGSKTCTNPLTTPLTAAGRRTTFAYASKSLTKVLGTEHDHSGVKITALVHIDAPVKGCELHLRLSEVELHDLDSKDQASSTISPNQEDFKRALEREPLRFQPTSGDLVICPHQVDPIWVVNVKRGILSALRYNEDIHHLQGKPQQGQLESDIHGNCPVEYLPIDDETATVVRRLKNLTACHNRETLSTGLPTVSYTVASPSQALPLTTTSHHCDYRIQPFTAATGARLDGVVCRETLRFRPLSRHSNGIVTEIEQELRRTEDNEIPRDIIYAPMTQFRKSNIHFEAVPSTTMDQSAGQTQVLSTLADICTSVAKDIRPDTPRLFTQLVYQLRKLSTEDMTEISRRVGQDTFCSVNNKALRSQFYDALSFTGTPASVAALMAAYSADQLSTSDLDLWLGGLPFQRSPPTADVLDSLLPLISSASPRKQALLGVSSVLHRFCQQTGPSDCETNSPSARTLSSAFLNHLGDDCTSDKPTRDVIVLLKAVGNAGIASAVPRLLACASKTNNAMAVRVAALQAFRRIPCSVDHSGLHTLLTNTDLDTELRISAYLGIMTCPTSNQLFAVKDLLEHEPVNQVGSFIWTHLTNLRETADPLRQTVRAILEDSRLRQEFDLEKLKFSRNIEKTLFLPGWNLGGQVESNLIWSQNSFLPRSASLNLTADLIGRSINLFNMEARVEGLEPLLEKLLGPEGYLRRGTKVQSKKKSGGYLEALRQVEGNLGVQIFGEEMAVLDLVKGDLTPDSMNFNLFDLINGGDRKFDISKSLLLLDSSVSVPTSLGLPLTVSINASASTQIGGQGRIRLAWPAAQINLEGDLKPSAALLISGLVSLDSNFATHGVRVTSTLHTSTELGAVVRVAGPEDFHVEMKTPNANQEIASFSSDVFVVRRGEDLPQTVPDKNMTVHEICSGEIYTKLFGVKTCASLSYPTVTTDISRSLTGPTSGKIVITKSDSQASYKLKGSIKSKASPSGGITSRFLRLELDTPESKIQRNFLLDFILDPARRIFKAHLVTPWKTGLIEAVLLNEAASKRLALRFQIDDKVWVRIEGNHKRGETSADGSQLDLTDLAIQIPQMKPILAYWKIRTDTSGIRRIELLIDELFKEPIRGKGILKPIDSSNSKLALGSGKYALTAEYQSMLGDGTVKGTFQLNDFLNKIDLTLRHLDKDKKDQRPYIISLRHKMHDMSSMALRKESLVSGISFGRNGDRFYRVIFDRELTEKHFRGNYEIQYGASGDGDATAFKEVIAGNIFGNHVLKGSERNIEFGALFEAPTKEMKYTVDAAISLSPQHYQSEFSVKSKQDKYIEFSGFFRDQSESFYHLTGGLNFEIPEKKVEIEAQVKQVSESRFELQSKTKYNDKPIGTVETDITFENLLKMELSGHFLSANTGEKLFNFETGLDIGNQNSMLIFGKVKVLDHPEYYMKLFHKLHVDTDEWSSSKDITIESGIYANLPFTQFKLMTKLIRNDYSLLHEAEFSLGDEFKYGYHVNFVLPRWHLNKRELEIATGAYYPGRTLNFRINWVMEHLKMNSQVDVQWANDKRINAHAMYELDDGWTQKGIVASVTVRTPFDGYKHTHLGVNGLGQLRYRKLDIEYNWGNKKRIKLDITVIPISSNNFDATVTLVTPFTRMSYVGIHAKHRITDTSLITTARCELGPRTMYAIAVELHDNSYNGETDLSGRFNMQTGNDPEIKLEVSHKNNDKSAHSSALVQWSPIAIIAAGLEFDYSLTGRYYLTTKGVATLTTPESLNWGDAKLSWSHENTEKTVVTSLTANYRDFDILNTRIRYNVENFNGMDGSLKVTTKIYSLDEMMLFLSLHLNEDMNVVQATMNVEPTQKLNYKLSLSADSNSDKMNVDVGFVTSDERLPHFMYTFGLLGQMSRRTVNSKLRLKWNDESEYKTIGEVAGHLDVKYNYRGFLDYIPESSGLDITLKSIYGPELQLKTDFMLSKAEGKVNLMVTHGGEQWTFAQVTVYTSEMIKVDVELKTRFPALRKAAVNFELLNGEGKFKFEHNDENKLIGELTVRGFRVMKGHFLVDIKAIGSKSVTFGSEIDRNTLTQYLKAGGIEYQLGIDWRAGVSVKGSLKTPCKYMEFAEVAVNYDLSHPRDVILASTLSHKSVWGVHSTSAKLALTNNNRNVIGHLKVNLNDAERKIEFQHDESKGCNFVIVGSTQKLQFSALTGGADRYNIKLNLNTDYAVLSHLLVNFNYEGHGSTFKHSHGLALRTFEKNYEIKNTLDIVSLRYLNIESKLVIQKPIYSFVYNHIAKVNRFKVALTIETPVGPIVNGEINIETGRILQITIRFGPSQTENYFELSIRQKMGEKGSEMKHTSKLKVLDYFLKNDIEWTLYKYLSVNATALLPSLNGEVTAAVLYDSYQKRVFAHASKLPFTFTFDLSPKEGRSQVLLNTSRFVFLSESIREKKTITRTTTLHLNSKVPVFKYTEIMGHNKFFVRLQTTQPIKNIDFKLNIERDSESKDLTIKVNSALECESIERPINFGITITPIALHANLEAPKLDKVSLDYTINYDVSSSKYTATANFAMPKYLSKAIDLTASYSQTLTGDTSRIIVNGKLTTPLEGPMRSIQVNMDLDIDQTKFTANGELSMETLAPSKYQIKIDRKSGKLQVECPLWTGAAVMEYKLDEVVSVSLKLAEVWTKPWSFTLEAFTKNKFRLEAASPFDKSDTLKLTAAWEEGFSTFRGQFEINSPLLQFTTDAKMEFTQDGRGHIPKIVFDFEAQSKEKEPLKLNVLWDDSNTLLLTVKYQTPFAYLQKGEITLKGSDGLTLDAGLTVNGSPLTFSGKQLYDHYSAKLTSEFENAKTVSIDLKSANDDEEQEYSFEINHNLLPEKITAKLTVKRNVAELSASSPFPTSGKSATIFGKIAAQGDKFDVNGQISIPTDSPFKLSFNLKVERDNSVIKADMKVRSLPNSLLIPEEVDFSAQIDEDKFETNRMTLHVDNINAEASTNREADGSLKVTIEAKTPQIYNLNFNLMKTLHRFSVNGKISTPLEAIKSVTFLTDTSYEDNKFNFKLHFEHNLIGKFQHSFKIEFQSHNTVIVTGSLNTPFDFVRSNELEITIKERSLSALLVSSALSPNLPSEGRIQLLTNWEMIGRKKVFNFKLTTPFNSMKLTEISVEAGDLGNMYGIVKINQTVLGTHSATFLQKWPSPRNLHLNIHLESSFESFKKLDIDFKLNGEQITGVIECSQLQNNIELSMVHKVGSLELEVNTPFEILKTAKLAIAYPQDKQNGKLGFTFITNKIGSISKYLSWNFVDSNNQEIYYESQTPFKGYESSNGKLLLTANTLSVKIESSRFSSPFEFYGKLDASRDFEVSVKLATPFQNLESNYFSVSCVNSRNENTFVVSTKLEQSYLGAYSGSFRNRQLNVGQFETILEMATPIASMKSFQVKIQSTPNSMEISLTAPQFDQPIQATLNWKLEDGDLSLNFKSNQDITKEASLQVKYSFTAIDNVQFSLIAQHNKLGSCEFKLDTKAGSNLVTLTSSLLKEPIKLSFKIDISRGITGNFVLETPFKNFEKTDLAFSASGNKFNYEIGAKFEQTVLGRYVHTNTWRLTSRNWYNLNFFCSSPYGEWRLDIEGTPKSIQAKMNLPQLTESISLSAQWNDMSDKYTLSTQMNLPFKAFKSLNLQVEIPQRLTILGKYESFARLNDKELFKFVHSCNQSSVGSLSCQSTLGTPKGSYIFGGAMLNEPTKRMLKLQLQLPNDNTALYKVNLIHEKVSSVWTGNHELVTPFGTHKVLYNWNDAKQLTVQLECSKVGNWKIELVRIEPTKFSINVNCPYQNLKLTIDYKLPQEISIAFSNSESLDFQGKFEYSPAGVKLSYTNNKEAKGTYELGLDFTTLTLQKSEATLYTSMNGNTAKLTCTHQADLKTMLISCRLDSKGFPQIPEVLKAKLDGSLEVTSWTSGSAKLNVLFGEMKGDLISSWNEKEMQVTVNTPFNGYESNEFKANLQAEDWMTIEKVTMVVKLGERVYSGLAKFVIGKTFDINLQLKTSSNDFSFATSGTLESNRGSISVNCNINSFNIVKLESEFSSTGFEKSFLTFQLSQNDRRISNLKFEHTWMAKDLSFKGYFQLMDYQRASEFNLKLNGWQKFSSLVMLTTSNDGGNTQKTYNLQLKNSLITSEKGFELEIETVFMDKKMRIVYRMDSERNGVFELESPLPYLNIKGQYNYRFDATQINSKLVLNNEILGQYGLIIKAQLGSEVALLTTLITPQWSKTLRLSGNYKKTSEGLSVYLKTEFPEMQPIIVNFEIKNSNTKSISVLINGPHSWLKVIKIQGALEFNNIKDFTLTALYEQSPFGEVLNVEVSNTIEKGNYQQKCKVSILGKSAGFYLNGRFTPFFIGTLDVFTPIAGFQKISISGEKLENGVDFKLKLENGENSQIRLSQNGSGEDYENDFEVSIPNSPVDFISVKTSRKRSRRSVSASYGRRSPISIQANFEPTEKSLSGDFKIFGPYRMSGRFHHAKVGENEINFNHSLVSGNNQEATLKGNVIKEDGSVRGNIAVTTPWQKMKKIHLEMYHIMHPKEGLKFDHRLIYEHEKEDKKFHLMGRFLTSPSKTSGQITVVTPLKQIKNLEASLLHERHENGRINFDHQIRYNLEKLIRLSGEGKLSSSSLDGRLTFNSPFKRMEHLEMKLAHTYSQEGKHTFDHSVAYTPRKTIRFHGHFHPSQKGISGGAILTPLHRSGEHFFHVKILHQYIGSDKIAFDHSLSYHPLKKIQCHGFYQSNAKITHGNVQFNSHFPMAKNILVYYNHSLHAGQHTCHHGYKNGNVHAAFRGNFQNHRNGIKLWMQLRTPVKMLNLLEANIHHMRSVNGRLNYDHSITYGPVKVFSLVGNWHLAHSGIISQSALRTTLKHLKLVDISLNHSKSGNSKWEYNHQVIYGNPKRKLHIVGMYDLNPARIVASTKFTTPYEVLTGMKLDLHHEKDSNGYYKFDHSFEHNTENQFRIRGSYLPFGKNTMKGKLELLTSLEKARSILYSMSHHLRTGKLVFNHSVQYNEYKPMNINGMITVQPQIGVPHIGQLMIDGPLTGKHHIHWTFHKTGSNIKAALSTSNPRLSKFVLDAKFPSSIGIIWNQQKLNISHGEKQFLLHAEEMHPSIIVKTLHLAVHYTKPVPAMNMYWITHLGNKRESVTLEHKTLNNSHKSTLHSTYPSIQTASLSLASNPHKFDFEWNKIKMSGSWQQTDNSIQTEIATSCPLLQEMSLFVKMNPKKELVTKLSFNKKETLLYINLSDTAIMGKFETNLLNIKPITINAKWSKEQDTLKVLSEGSYGIKVIKLQATLSPSEIQINIMTPFSHMENISAHLKLQAKSGLYAINGEIKANNQYIKFSHQLEILRLSTTDRSGISFSNSINSNVLQWEKTSFAGHLIKSLDIWAFGCDLRYNQNQIATSFKLSKNSLEFQNRFFDSKFSLMLTRQKNGELSAKVDSQGVTRFSASASGSLKTFTVALETPFDIVKSLKFNFNLEQAGAVLKHKSSLDINVQRIYTFDGEFSGSLPNIDLTIRSPIDLKITAAKSGVLLNGEVSFFVKYNGVLRGGTSRWNFVNQVACDLLITTSVRNFKLSFKSAMDKSQCLHRLQINPNTKWGEKNAWAIQIIGAPRQSLEVTLVTPLRTLYAKVVKLANTDTELQFSWNHITSGEHTIKIIVKRVNDGSSKKAKLEVQLPRMKNPIMIHLVEETIEANLGIRWQAIAELTSQSADNIIISLTLNTPSTLKQQISLSLTQKSTQLYIAGALGISRQPSTIKINSLLKIKDANGKLLIWSIGTERQASQNFAVHRFSLESPRKSVVVSTTFERTQVGHKLSADILSDKQNKYAVYLETNRSAPSVVLRLFNNPKSSESFVEMNTKYVNDRHIEMEIFRKNDEVKVTEIKATVELKAEHLLSGSFYRNNRISIPYYQTVRQFNVASYLAGFNDFFWGEFSTVESVLKSKFQQVTQGLPDLQDVMLYFDREIRLLKKDISQFKRELNRMIRRNDFYMGDLTLMGMSLYQIIDVNIAIPIRNMFNTRLAVYYSRCLWSAYYQFKQMERLTVKFARLIAHELYAVSKKCLYKLTDYTMYCIQELHQATMRVVNRMTTALKQLHETTVQFTRVYLGRLFEPVFQYAYGTTVRVFRKLYSFVRDLKNSNLAYLPYEKQIRLALSSVMETLDQAIKTYTGKLRNAAFEASQFVDRWIGIENCRTVIDIAFDGSKKLRWILANTYSEEFIRGFIRNEYIRVLDSLKYGTIEAVAKFFKLDRFQFSQVQTKDGFQVSGQIYSPLAMRDLKSLPEMVSLDSLRPTFHSLRNPIPELQLARQLGWEFPSIIDTQTSWMPQFDSFGSLAGNHVITLDKEQFNLEGDCTALLAGREDWAIQVIQSRVKHLQIMAHGKEIKLLPNYQVTVDGVLTELPYSIESLSIVRIGPLVKLTDNILGFSVTADSEVDIYTIGVSGWHHGKVAGLLGNRDNEPFNDIRNKEGQRVSVDEFVRAWTLKGKCVATKIEPQQKTTSSEQRLPNLPCKFLFQCPISPLAKCFKAVNPAPFMKMCAGSKDVDDDVSNNCPGCPVKRMCSAARAYAAQCARAKIAVRVPYICRKCPRHQTSPADTATPTAEVVVVVQPGCLRNSPDLASVIRRLDSNLRKSQLVRRVRYGLAASSGLHSFTVNGGSMMTDRWQDIAKSLNRIPSKHLLGNPLDTVEYASREYPWKQNSDRNILLIQCSKCEESSADLAASLAQQNVKLHIVTPQSFAYSQRTTARPGLGISLEKIYSHRHPAGHPLSHSARGYLGDENSCIQGALNSGGSVFNLKLVLAPVGMTSARQRGLVIDIFVKQLVSKTESNLLASSALPVTNDNSGSCSCRMEKDWRGRLFEDCRPQSF